MSANPVDDIEPGREAKPRSWRFEITECGRPLLTNGTHRMQGVQATRARQVWKEAGWAHALEQRVPALSAIRVTVRPRYRTRKGCDCDAPAPSVKGVLDGLVLAGVVPDDRPPFVQSVTYLACDVGTGLADALIVIVEEAS